jgi:LysM repeat protein
MYDNASKCLYNGSHIMGYCCGPDRRYQIVPEQAAIVRMVFNLYCDGMTITQICHHLNGSGLTTNRGKPFCYSRVWNILNNERYTGVYIFGDVRIPDGMPPIIERSVFEEAQRMKKKTARHVEQGVVDYLLTGKAFCGLCGAAMVGDSGTSASGNRLYYYSCIDRKHRKSCNKKSIRKERLEDAVINYVLDYVLSDSQIEKTADAVMALQAEELKTSPLTAMEAEYEEAKKKIDNVNKAIARSGGKQNFWQIYPYLPRETRGYVPAFIAAAYIMNFYPEHGLHPKRVTIPLRTDTVMVERNMTFANVSKYIGIDIDELRGLNPQYRADYIPGQNGSYPLCIPTNKMNDLIQHAEEIFRDSEDSLSAAPVVVAPAEPRPVAKKQSSSSHRKSGNVYHKVRRGENLTSIAAKHGTTVHNIKKLNNLRSDRIRYGQRLRVK